VLAIVSFQDARAFVSFCFRRRIVAFTIAATGLIAVTGCGGTNSASGEIRFDGKRVGNGSITFTPKVGPVVGGMITDGRYQVDGLTPGTNKVQIVAVKKVNFAASNAELERQAKENATHGDATGIVERADEIPEDADGNNRDIDIKPGKQTLDFDLKRKAGR
jgi:hypothetical protein